MRAVLRNTLRLTLLVCLIVTPGIARAQTAGHVLWQIGQEDHDDKEFALAPNQWSRYRDDSFYIVGQSKPKNDWNYVQPGPDDAWANSQPHTFHIDFVLAQTATQGTCRLTLAFVDTQQSAPPQLQIRVNGQSWTRETSGGGGDDSINGQPNHGKASTVSVDFPASLLSAGLNNVQITTLRGSWMVYDAITLSTPDGVTLGSAPSVCTINSAEWLPNVLKRQANTLVQVLQLQCFNSGSPKDVAVHVSGEADRRLTVPGGHSILELTYPESKIAAQTQVQFYAQEKPFGGSLTLERTPCRRYTIYCLEHSHMDIGYAYLQPKALALHQKYLEDGLRLNAQDAHLPSDDRFRWNVESLYEVDDWLKHATAAQRASFQTAAKSGNLGLSALYCNELTGLCRPDELATLLACANEIHRRYGIPIDSAMISDVPGYTWGLVPMLAQSGVKYFSWGPNGGDHIGFARGFDNKAFYWVSPSGREKVLVWQSPNGYYPDFNANAASLTQFLRNFERQNPNYPYDMIYDRHTQADNGPADLDLAPFVRKWNSQYAFPHLVMSTTSRMFHDFEAKYGRRLPQVRGDFTGYWEDGAASTAQETAINRRATELIAQDQILTAMLSPTHYPQSRFEDAWKNAVLYDEHTWGADRSWSQPESDFTRRQWAYKRQFALNAMRQAQALRRDALKTVTASEFSNTISVFNTSSWQRSDLVILPTDMSRAGDVVRDEYGQAVASQRLKDGTLAFMASDIPALASHKFRILPGRSHSNGSATAIADGVLKTAGLSLQIDPQTGAILHWKVNGIAQDLVGTGLQTSRGLNDYLYVLGANNANVQHASHVRVAVVDSGPLVATLRIDSAAPGCKSLSRLVRVIDGLNQVWIEDRLDKRAVHEDEAVHFGFNFHVPGGAVHMDMPWSVVRPDKDQTVNANKNVYPVGRWVDVSNQSYGVTCANLDSPLMQIGAITALREAGGDWLRSAKTGSAFYWNAMNNYWHTNYKAYQPDSAVFRYVLSAHGEYDQAAAQRFGIDQSQPLLFTPVKPGQADAHLPLMIDNTSVQVTDCRPTADGKTWLVRLFNGSSQAQTLTLAWNGNKNVSIAATDLWGNGNKEAKNPIRLQPLEVLTLRVLAGASSIAKR